MNIGIDMPMKSVLVKGDNTMDKNEMWEELIARGIATEAELQLVTDIVGYTEEALYDVLFARTGYRNFEQMEDE